MDLIDLQNSGVWHYVIQVEISTAQKIREFGELSSGWHYGEGGPIDEKVIRSAVEINDEALNESLWLTDAFPGVNGEIVVTVYWEKECLEFTIETDGTVSFVLERDRVDVSSEDGLSLDRAKDRIREFAGRVWTLSNSSTQNTSIDERRDLDPWLSVSGDPHLEYQFSPNPALKIWDQSPVTT